jgi:hypothetical protein
MGQQAIACGYARAIFAPLRLCVEFNAKPVAVIFMQASKGYNSLAGLKPKSTGPYREAEWASKLSLARQRKRSLRPCALCVEFNAKQVVVIFQQNSKGNNSLCRTIG